MREYCKCCSEQVMYDTKAHTTWLLHAVYLHSIRTATWGYWKMFSIICGCVSLKGPHGWFYINYQLCVLKVYVDHFPMHMISFYPNSQSSSQPMFSCTHRSRLRFWIISRVLVLTSGIENWLCWPRTQSKPGYSLSSKNTRSLCVQYIDTVFARCKHSYCSYWPWKGESIIFLCFWGFNVIL